MTHWKKTLIGLLGISTAYAAGTALTPADLKKTLTDREEAYFLAHGQYEIIPETTVDGVTYRVDTITVWDGKPSPKDKGYQIYITKNNVRNLDGQRNQIQRPLSYPECYSFTSNRNQHQCALK